MQQQQYMALPPARMGTSDIFRKVQLESLQDLLLTNPFEKFYRQKWFWLRQPILRVIVLLATSATSLHAQLSWSASAGLNTSNLIYLSHGEEDYAYTDHKHHYGAFAFGGAGLHYELPHFNISSGLYLSTRGAVEDYIKVFTKTPSRQRKTSLYLEIPFIVTRYLYKQKLELGGGPGYTLRLMSDEIRVGDEHRFHGAEIKVLARYHFSRNLGLEGSYLLGNVDKYLQRRKDIYMQSVFGLGLNWTFAHARLKDARNELERTKFTSGP